MDENLTMVAVRLHGPRDLRVERVPCPELPGPGMALLRITAVGVCGSDIHTYQDARIGDTVVETPLILGHEFAGVVEAVGAESLDGNASRCRWGRASRSTRRSRAGAVRCASKAIPTSATGCTSAAPIPTPAA
jgi:threonine dehydrogenase-like Zn-dependent dehydrogenase